MSRDFSTSRAPRGQQQEEVRPTSLSTTSPVPAARAERRRKRRSGRLRSICHMLACLEGLASSAHLQRTTTRTASLLVRVTTSLHGTSCHFTSWCELEFWKHRQRIASSIELRKHRRRLRLPGEAPAGSFSELSNAEGRRNNNRTTK